MSAKHGIESVLARNTGTWSTPIWAELESVVSVTPPAGWEDKEIRTRASRVVFGAKVALPLAFDFRILCDDDDIGYTALLVAFQDLRAVIDLLVIDGPMDVVGSFGYRGKFQISSGAQEQPPDDVLYREFHCVAYPDTTEIPQFAEVMAGTPPVLTFTDI